jgi:hypothetical protein
MGVFERWDTEAAQLAAALLARRQGITVSELCTRVISGMSARVAAELVSKVLEDSGATAAWDREPTAAAFLHCALNGDEGDASELECHLTLRRPVVAIGAPVAAYLPTVATKLNTDLVIPPWSDVANAVGAVAGSVTQRTRVSIAPVDQGERYRAYLPDGFHDFEHLEDAVEFARRMILPSIEDQVRAAGAEQVESAMTRRDEYAPVSDDPADRLYLGTELEFRAGGRPSFAREASPTGGRATRE